MKLSALPKWLGYTTIRGDEWLEHPGSVGKPEVCDVLILDEHENPGCARRSRRNLYAPSGLRRTNLLLPGLRPR